MLPVPQIDEQQKDFYIRIGLTLSITTFYLYFSFDIYSLGETWLNEQQLKWVSNKNPWEACTLAVSTSAEVCIVFLTTYIHLDHSA